MIGFVPFGSPQPEPMDAHLICPTAYAKEQAERANQAFDEAVKQYLRHWIEQGTAAGVDRSHESESDTEAFIENGALRSFFKHHDDALERLLQDESLARHLLRPGTEVYFEPDAYEPLLAKFEKRIYNLAAHREHREVSFRYSPTSRQGTYGDSVGLADLPVGEGKEDIGLYFGTRRSDETALNILARQLRCEALFSTALPIHVVTEGYFQDSLRAVRARTEAFAEAGDDRLHCFVIQRRHAADDRHLGAALLLMNPARPNQPQRIIFCDTLNPDGEPPWWNKFKGYVDAVFLQPAGQAPVSDRLEDGGVNLQRLHDGVPVRHQDIDCAFYTASIARGLIQVAKLSPEVLVAGSIGAIVGEMTQRIPEYFERADRAKAPERVREVNVIRRWQTGQAALADIRQRYAPDQTAPRPGRPEPDAMNWEWEPADSPAPRIDLSAAA